MNLRKELDFGFKALILGLMLIVGTFPANDWSFSVGIDPPLQWVFNFLFEHNLELGKNIIFPHGPLAFLMYPLSENILLTTLVSSALKLLLMVNVVLLLPKTIGHFRWLLSFLFAYFIATITGFNHLVLANLILLYCNAYFSGNHIFKYLAIVITAFSFYIKAYVAIISAILFLSFQMYTLFQRRNYKQFVFDGLLLGALMWLLWLIMYGTFGGFFGYVWGMMQLAQDNSSAAAYYPYNNWVVLTLFLLSLSSVFLIRRTKLSTFFGVLTALSLFAAWKHGMAREDIYHINGFFIYTLICLSVFLLLHKQNAYLKLILSVVALFLFAMNMNKAVKYYTPSYEIFRVNNFIDFTTRFAQLKKQSEEISRNNISHLKLSQQTLEMVSGSTVDIYPWDYSVIAANKLNWRPRVVIQSYASYTSYLDGQNARHLASDQAPDYFLWESDKISKDYNGGDLNSIDNRYLLNDEPQTMLQFMSNYDYCCRDGKYLIYKKRTESVLFKTHINEAIHVTWNQWVKVPEMNHNLLRAKLKFDKSFLQVVKSFFYKDEQFWIYFKLRSGAIHKYRIVPKNASDGLWINPYLFDFNSALRIEEVMFKASNQRILTDILAVEWEQIEFVDDPVRLQKFFNVSKFEEDTLISQYSNNFETTAELFWTPLSDDQFGEPYNGKRAHFLPPQSFSTSFSIPLDSLPPNDLRITADCWVKSQNYKLSNDILLVITIEDESGSVIWNGIPIDYQQIDRNEWNHVFNFVNFHNSGVGQTLKVYVYNSSNVEVLIDDFRVMVYETQ